MSNDEGIGSVKLIQIAAPDFDLEKTLNSGQVFHWENYGNGFVGTIAGSAVYAEQREDILQVRFGETPKPAREPGPLPKLAARYSASDHQLKEIGPSSRRDPSW